MMMCKRLFKMTDEQRAKILEASKPVPWFAPGGVWPKTPRENAEAAWKALGEEMGFDWTTVTPAAPAQDDFHFLAMRKGE
jgi:hypothetical protein